MLKGQLFTEKNISVQILTDNGIIAAFCVDWECSCVSPSADGEELSSCCCLDAPSVLCY